MREYLKLLKERKIFAITLIAICASFGALVIVSNTQADDTALCNPYGACIDDTGYPGCYVNDTCATDLFCGDDIYTALMEECDNGIANHPEGSMEPVWNPEQGQGDRNYCSTECEVFHVPGTWCGDGVIQGDHEQCETDSDCTMAGATCNGCECIGECIDNEVIACQTGLPGICADGEKLCTNGAWGTCEGAVMPGDVAEICDNGLDDDCDGFTDNDDEDCVVEKTGDFKVCKINDLNRNGQYDSGEPVVSGWSFMVNGEKYTAYETCVYFYDMPYGKYEISEIPQKGWEFSGIDGDAIAQADNSAILKLDSPAESVKFLNKTLICGKKIDFMTKQGLPNWTINLSVTQNPADCPPTGCQMSFITLLATTQTDANGDYCFDLSDVTYNLNYTDTYLQVAEMMQAGWQAQTPTHVEFEFDSSAPVFVDFYNYQIQPVCGDGEVNGSNEQCDNGTANGIPCDPAYGETCSFCNIDCQIEEVTGPYCGDGTVNGSEECDDGNTTAGDGCDASCAKESCVDEFSVNKSPFKAILDNGLLVTYKVKKSDNYHAKQIVKFSPDYIYLKWSFSGVPSNATINKAILTLEHKEKGVDMSVEMWNGYKFVEVCNPAEASVDTKDQCDLSAYLKDANDVDFISIRVKYSKTGCGFIHIGYLDWADLSLDYTVPGICDDGDDTGDDVVECPTKPTKPTCGCTGFFRTLLEYKKHLLSGCDHTCKN